MIITIDNILKQRNKTRYWLAKETGISYPNIKRLCDNKTTSIKFVMIDSICTTLECSPNDIFRMEGLK